MFGTQVAPKPTQTGSSMDEYDKSCLGWHVDEFGILERHPLKARVANGQNKISTPFGLDRHWSNVAKEENRGIHVNLLQIIALLENIPHEYAVLVVPDDLFQCWALLGKVA